MLAPDTEGFSRLCVCVCNEHLKLDGEKCVDFIDFAPVTSNKGDSPMKQWPEACTHWSLDFIQPPSCCPPSLPGSLQPAGWWGHCEWWFCGSSLVVTVFLWPLLLLHNRIYLLASGPTVSGVRWAGLTMVMHLRRKVLTAFKSELLGGFCILLELRKAHRTILQPEKDTFATCQSLTEHNPIRVCVCVYVSELGNRRCSVSSSSKWWDDNYVC